jgi:hypothetical protein
MDSRKILPETKELHFLLETESLDDLPEKQSINLERFLRYNNHDTLYFLRTPGKPDHDLLKTINHLEIEKDVEDNRQTVRWSSETEAVHSARYLPELYQNWINQIDWNDPTVSVEHLELIDLFSELSSNQEGREDIVVTENKSILSNRRLLEHCTQHHKKSRMHVMTVSEAAELAGIFMRQNDNFVFYMPEADVSSHEIDFTLWYWSIPKVFIQHYSTGGCGYLSSMLDRFEHLFLCIDKLGQQYYQGTGNHTDLRTRYHFNHGISLLTGICDVLALHTRDKYRMNIPDRNTNLRTGDYPLLKELEEHNEDAWLYVHANHEVIELLHTVRNDIIHQSGVIKRGPGFSFREHDETVPWESQALWMEELNEKDRKKFKKHYDEIDDTVEDYDPVTEWGVVTEFDEPPEIHEHSAIEPYRFLKRSTRELAEFSEEYLQLLDHPNRFEATESSATGSKGEVEKVVKYGLHPLLDDINPDELV